MRGFFTSITARLRWSHGSDAWKECLSTGMVLAGAACLAAASMRLSAAQLAVGGGLLLVLLAVLMRRGWIKLVGPVFFYDLVRSSRRRVIALRCFYTSVLLLILVCPGIVAFERFTDSPWDALFVTNLPAAALADVASGFTALVLGVQLVVVCLLAPLIAASCLPEERQRGTLQFLLTTDLRNHEIVLGVLLSRVALLGLLLMAGLPILSLLQLLGGVDPELLLLAYGVTALTAVSLASLALACSVYARRPVAAVMTTFTLAVAYLAVSGGARWMVVEFPALSACSLNDIGEWIWTGRPGSIGNSSAAVGDWTWGDPIYLGEIADALAIGNPGTALYDLNDGLYKGQALSEVLLPLLRYYVAFHGGIILLSVGWSVLRVRAVSLQQVSASARRKTDDERSASRWLGTWPLLWKELYARGSRRWRWLGVNLLVLAVFGSALCILVLHALTIPAVNWQELRLHMSAWTRVCSSTLAGLMLVTVAVQAAVSISGERDRQTLDTLLTTPLGCGQIVRAKWLASLLAARWAWLWLGLTWAVGWYCGGLGAEDIPYLIVTCFVGALLMAGLGLWVSARSTSSSRALLGTLIAVLVAWFGHWVIVAPAALLFDLNRPDMDWFWQFEQYGLTPPLTLDYLASRGQFLVWRWYGGYEESRDIRIACTVGTLFWFAVSVLFLFRAEQRFRAAVGRGSMTKPAPPSETPAMSSHLPVLAGKD